jgi:hypothetical protein
MTQATINPSLRPRSSSLRLPKSGATSTVILIRLTQIGTKSVSLAATSLAFYIICTLSWCTTEVITAPRR